MNQFSEKQRGSLEGKSISKRYEIGMEEERESPTVHITKYILEHAPPRPDSSCLFDHQSSEMDGLQTSQKTSKSALDLLDITHLVQPLIKEVKGSKEMKNPIGASIQCKKGEALITPKSQFNSKQIQISKIFRKSENFTLKAEKEQKQREKLTNREEEKENLDQYRVRVKPGYSFKLNLEKSCKAKEKEKEERKNEGSSKEREIAWKQRRFPYKVEDQIRRYDLKFSQFEKKIKRLREENQSTQRELETTKLLLHDNSSASFLSARNKANSTFLKQNSCSPKLNRYFTQQRFNPLKEAQTGNCNSAREHFIKSRDSIGWKKALSRSPLTQQMSSPNHEEGDSLIVKNLELGSLMSSFYGVRDSECEAPIPQNSQDKEETKRREMVSSFLQNQSSIVRMGSQNIEDISQTRNEELNSEGTSFVFDKDIDEHSTGESKRANFYQISRDPISTSGISLISSQQIQMASPQVETIKKLLKHYEVKICKYQRSRIKAERENARLKEVVKHLLNTSGEPEPARYFSCDSSQFLNFSRDYLTGPRRAAPERDASFYQRAEDLKDFVVFKSEVTLVDQEQNHKNGCRIL